MAVTTRKKAGWGAANTVAILIVAIPVLWLVSLSFKAPGDDHRRQPLAAHWTWGNYSGIFQRSTFVRALLNSVGVGLVTTVIAVVLASMAAYAIARLGFAGKQLSGGSRCSSPVPADLAG